MKNRHDDTPEINEYTYHVFERIEERGLQFAIPEQWRPLYRSFLRERKRKREIAAAFQGIARAFELSNRTECGSYQDDFGDKGAAAREENSTANTATRPLEE
jgi:hypothetical protein